MSQSDYINELHEAEIEQGISKIRTLALEFSSTLEHLPKLKKDVDVMLKPQKGINYDVLAAHLEQQLEKATNLLASLDLLPSQLRFAKEIEEFSSRLQNAMTIRAIDHWYGEFNKKCDDATVRIENEKKDGEQTTEREKHDKEEAAKKTEQRNTPVYIDNKLGLMWVKNGNLVGRIRDREYVIKCVSQLEIGGYKDWRLPTKTECQAFLLEIGNDFESRYKWLKLNGFYNIQCDLNDFYHTNTGERFWGSDYYYFMNFNTSKIKSTYEIFAYILPVRVI
ncbi:MAG: hypothetical protein WCL46_08735 [Chlorobium sp.]